MVVRLVTLPEGECECLEQERRENNQCGKGIQILRCYTLLKLNLPHLNLISLHVLECIMFLSVLE